MEMTDKVNLFISLGIYSLFPLIGQVHAGEDEDGADEEINGDLLGEDGPGEENGGDGVEIDVVGGCDCTEFLQDPVPGEEAPHRGDAAEEQQIEENGKIEGLKN